MADTPKLKPVLMTSEDPKRIFQLPVLPLTLPPKYIHRAYATSVSESDSIRRSPPMMSDPQVPRSPLKPIIHQRPLVLRPKQPPSPSISVASSASGGSPAVQLQIASVLSPTPTLVATPPPAVFPPSRPANSSPQLVPLLNGVTTTTITASTPNPSTLVSIFTPLKSTRTLIPHNFPELSPGKSLRQRAFEKAQAPPQVQRPRHKRQKLSTGQRMKEGAFFAFIILPMSCWYTRGGKFGGQNMMEQMQFEDNDDADSMDSRAPRITSPPKEEILRPKTPVATRRMSDDGYRRRNSLSSSRTPTTKRNGELGRTVNFDGKVTVMTDRSNAVVRREEAERAKGMARQRANTLGRRESFESPPFMPRERATTVTRRESFNGASSFSRERANTLRGHQGFHRTGSFTQSDKPVARPRAMSRREWELELERMQDKRRKQAPFGGDRIVSMGMPPPVMAAERWLWDMD